MLSRQYVRTLIYTIRNNLNQKGSILIIIYLISAPGVGGAGGGSRGRGGGAPHKSRSGQSSGRRPGSSGSGFPFRSSTPSRGSYYQNNNGYYRTPRSKSAHGGSRTKQVLRKGPSVTNFHIMTKLSKSK
jgi:hypothetical protein